jgi:peptide/nickel transport system substrate-binding protein
MAQGGTITIAQSSQPDSLDPALGYTSNSWEPSWLVWTGLLTYAHEEGERGTRLVPGLAAELPTVLPDGRIYALRLRPGLRYSDGRPVLASDFELTIKRVLSLDSGGASFYLGIVGAREYLLRGRAAADIPGIVTDDETARITIRLTRPDSAFPYALALPFAGLVPGDTPFRDLTRSPPAGVGAYRITSSAPHRAFVLQRNELFDVPGIPKGNVDRIRIRIMRSVAEQTRAVLGGDLDYMQDSPPRSFMPGIARSHADQYEEHASMSTYYFFMNRQEHPFDSPDVRRAVSYGIDRQKLARLFTPSLAPGCSFLPPGMPGYARRLDQGGCPWGAPTAPPRLARARSLIRRAGALGTKVTVWGNTDSPGRRVATAYARMLNAIGLHAHARVLPGATYFQTIGNRRTGAQTGFYNWFADYPHPLSFFSLVDGRSIQLFGNQNVGNVNVPLINRQISVLSDMPTMTRAVIGGWRAVNKRIVRRADVVPFGHRKLTTFVSARMNLDRCARFHPIYGNDYSTFCLK